MANKVVREGWMTQHPTNGKRVHVVNAAYCDQLEKENDELESTAESLQHRINLLERECMKLQTLLKTRLVTTRRDKGIILFDPVSGNVSKDIFTLEEYRQHHGLVAWLYNPWTGEPRDPRDIGSDVQGLLIEP